MNNIPAEITDQAEELSTQAENMLTVAKDYRISTNDEYAGAAVQLKDIKAKAKELDETRKGITGPMDEAKKRVMDFFRNPLQFLADAEAAIKRSMITYDNEQAKIRQAEERRLRELAEQEQARLTKIAEKKAEKAEAKGDTWKAEEIRESVPVISAPVLADNKVKVAGISTRTIWGGEVTDKMELVNAVAEGKAPATLLDVNMPVLNQMARALKAEMNYPGVKSVSTQSIAA